MRYLVKFSYDGSNFFGFQKQSNLRTVEEELEKALYNINDHKKTKIMGAGRTDRGVHANCQCAHFDLDITNITLYKLKCALNSLLPNDIHVFEVEEKTTNFHARYMVKKKEYKYIINMGEYNPLERNYVYQYNKDLNIEKMEKAIKDLVGKHNFKPFVSFEEKKEDYIREIYEAYIEKEKGKIIIHFIGKGFMKYQVRNMVGTLVKVGNGKLPTNALLQILNKEECSKMVTTINAQGLYLEKIEY